VMSIAGTGLVLVGAYMATRAERPRLAASGVSPRRAA
jgi:hypothetical protein